MRVKNSIKVDYSALCMLIVITILLILLVISTAPYIWPESGEENLSQYFSKVRQCQRDAIQTLFQTPIERAFNKLFATLPALTRRCASRFPFRVRRLESEDHIVYHVENLKDNFKTRKCQIISVNGNFSGFDDLAAQQRCSVFVGSREQLVRNTNVTSFNITVTAEANAKDSRTTNRVDLPSFITIHAGTTTVDQLIIDTTEQGYLFARYLYQRLATSYLPISQQFFIDRYEQHIKRNHRQNLFPRKIHQSETLITFDEYGITVCQMNLRYRRPTNKLFYSHFNEMITNIVFQQWYILLKAEVSDNLDYIWLYFINTGSSYCRNTLFHYSRKFDSVPELIG